MNLCARDEVPTIEILGGGVSNLVARVRARRGTWIIKQALPKLRVKDEWLAAQSRIFVETACLRLIRNLVDDHPAPAVVSEDRQDFACALEYAGDSSRTWKQTLLSGLVNSDVTMRVAKILTQQHKATWGNERVKTDFEDTSNFYQLRLDPYLATTARVHPDLKKQLGEVTEFLAKERLCLVHGDFSPKNVLLLPDGRIWVIDWEAAHYGNPVFDIAFCTNHLLLKAVHLNSNECLAEAQGLWTAYWEGLGSGHLEGEAVRTLAALMLARVDGKSPVEYLSPSERETARRVSRTLVRDREEDFSSLKREVLNSMSAGAAS